MPVVVHLSDLHFGRVDERLLSPLVAAVGAARPDVVVVSGDLTQRARKSEFRAARAFLDRLPGPRIIVPGNHDVPLYNVFDRFLRPLALFRRFIEPDPLPRFVGAGLAVIGVNTARALVVKNGRINEEQIQAIRAAFSPLAPAVMRVVVTHHPFDAGAAMDPGDRVGRAGLAMHAFAECGIDLLLSGHLHLAYSGEASLSARTLEGYGALAVSAGTATSTRVRGEPNEFNVLQISDRGIEIERHAWTPDTGVFARTGVSSFVRDDEGWRKS
ncbi:MAG: metallophosphoesterase [Betaproteobacteria bacterium]